MSEKTSPEPIRKSSLPCTPPPEYDFATVLGARPDGMDGCMLMPGDMGPKVIRRRVSYGDWEPVRPDHWAEEPTPDAGQPRPVAASADVAAVPPSTPLWERLTELSRLEDGWLDGHGKAPSAEVLELAGRIVTALPHAIGVVRVCPTEAGGVSLEWDDEHGGHEIEVMPDQHLFLLTVERGVADDVAALRRQVAAARKFASEMRDFCSPHGVAVGYADRLIEAMDQAKEGAK